jgi:hypothetical protein
MKTIDNLRQYLPVVVFSAILIASTVEASAQNYRGEGKKGKDHERKEYREPGRDDDRVVYVNRKGNYEKWNGNGREYRPKYNNRYKHYDADYFEHPKYGRVYQRFDRNPIVFHHDRSDYYYYGDHFYTYRRGTGYCVVEPPRNVYFRTLPVECERVYVDGHLLFRHGDLFFQLSPRGYVMAPSPIGIHISARF